MLNDIFMKYTDRYQASNILFITKVQYPSGDRNEENFFKMPSRWEFDGSFERDDTINTILSSLLNHLRHCPNMGHHLKTLKLK